MSEILVNTIKKADGTGGLTVPATAGDIVTTGGTTFTGAIAMGANNISFSNGNGIDFSASEGSGASSSILDDYETGTWTAVVSTDGTSTGIASISNEEYIKIGSIVHLHCQINLNSSGRLTSGTAISGQPFAASKFGGDT